jgi:hypothetical protein
VGCGWLEARREHWREVTNGGHLLLKMILAMEGYFPGLWGIT